MVLLRGIHARRYRDVGFRTKNEAIEYLRSVNQTGRSFTTEDAVIQFLQKWHRPNRLPSPPITKFLSSETSDDEKSTDDQKKCE